MRSQRRIAGFTLIELMIVVAIVAILAAVAYPSYVQYVVRANRAAAQGYLLEVTSYEQRYLLDARAYLATPTGACDATVLGIATPGTVSTNYCVVVTAPAGSPPTFLITATPIAGTLQATKDTQCATLTITQDGTKSASGSGGAAKCWQQ